MGDVHDALASALGDHLAVVFRDRRLSWHDVGERSRRLADVLHREGLGCHVEREHLQGWESGQDHLGIYLHNGNEYLESMLGAFKARVAPFNVNYRYVAAELRYLLNDAGARAIVVHSAFAPTLAEVRHEVPTLQLIIQVPDDSGNALLPGARWYDDVLADGDPAGPTITRSPDDLYILYTGGTTGMPKGVLWRQADAFVECFGGLDAPESMDDIVAAASSRLRAAVAPPFMHGAGHWVSFMIWNGGGTVLVQSSPERLDPHDIWSLVEREQATFLLIVGDAFARPLLDQLDRASYDLSHLSVLLSGGAALSVPLKRQFLDHLPTLMIVDGLGSSEAGGQMQHVSTGAAASTGTFPLAPGNHVLDAELTRELLPGDPELGWLAKSGRLALGYLGDEAKTRRTYPVVDGTRYAVPGDRAKLRADSTVELHGRESVTINSGGEKIFAEEVEAALKTHPSVYDCVVAGRPSERWGAEVVAVVAIREGHDVSDASLLEAAETQIARYKLPKAIVRVSEVVRSPSGKADYRWAAAQAAG